MDENCGVPSSGQDRAFGIMSSQQLCMPALGLRENGSVTRETWLEEGPRGFYPPPTLLNCLFLVDSDREGVIAFSSSG